MCALYTEHIYLEYHNKYYDPICQREEIIRCRDCKFYKEKVYKWVNNWTRTEKTCEVFDGCHVESGGFCAWGERKSE